MEKSGIRQRSNNGAKDKLDLGAGASLKTTEPKEHPGGHIKYGLAMQILRAAGSVGWFLISILAVHFTQFVGAPLYFYNKDYYYAWMALTKQAFAVLVITITQLFSPTLIRVSWDSSMQGELWQDKKGRLEMAFPERLVLMANHQIYTDWIYLWWLAYTNKMHGHVFIILKESLKYIPFLGPGMMFFGFVFMSRKWASDQARLAHRIKALKKKHTGRPPGMGQYDPMWLLIFPEGTNLSANTRKKSAAWAEKSKKADCKHVLLPRATGMHFCLQELEGTVEYVYDCTVAYEGVPEGGYAQDWFSLRSTFLQGRPPKSVNIHWRRFATAEIPTDQKSFEAWMEARWREKDEMLEQHRRTGRLPITVMNGKGPDSGYIETQVKLKNFIELSQVYVVTITICLLANIVRRFISRLF